MFKTLLASTALATFVATSAMAASTTTTATTDTTATEAETVVATDTNAAMAQGDNLASNLIGSAVYGSAAEDADMIGDINDIVITPEGDVASIIVGVGGFLGIGEKDVAVDYKTIEWVDRDGERWLVANMTREQLEAAPAYDRSALYNEARSTDEEMNATGQMAAEDRTAENIAEGESAVETAEEKTTTIDRSAMTQVTTDDLTAENLIGRTVYSSTDESIGEVGDVLLTADNKVEGFILDVGGFLGMGEKQVAVSPENLDIRADANGDLTIFTPFTQEQLEAQKEYSEENWEAERDTMILVVPAG
ncbi:PRC-barrel domain protein [Hoeflea halophila]|uniref:PRC-barrel domain protein n=1 Tax=Hoeflea halophila TaxID=714899 RepID=A0A286IEV4_9HYPH|nr:PRC-barrel domain-containing protein [Hoeflea halophila]SOE18655.1 PRC-barrel domain protein [Hoeflea halophila]